MMRSKRALAILTSLVLAIGTLSVSTFAADNSATAPTSSAAEDACANGHDYKLKNEVGPTCTEDGYREEVCSRCGDTRRVEGEKALGHDFSGEGRVTREATADREGELTFTCLRNGCNETKTEKIPKLEKTAEDTDAAPASSNQNQQDQNQADQTSQQESAAQNAGQTQKGEAAQNATLSIAGIPVPQEKGTIKAGESKIKFKREGEGNKEEITLTFDDSTLEVNGSSKKQPPEAVIAYTGTGTLNISIEGENAVTGKNSSYGVYAPDGTVKLTGKKGATIDIQAASENSNTIRAKKIVVDDSLEITGPENNYVFEGSNGMGGTYQTIAVANNGRNMAVSKVTIQDPNASDDKKDAEEKEEETKDEETTDEEKSDEKTDAAQDNADQTDTDKDETAAQNEAADQTGNGNEEQKSSEASVDDEKNDTEDASSQDTPVSTKRKLGAASRTLGAPPEENNEGNTTGNTSDIGNNNTENGPVNRNSTSNITSNITGEGNTTGGGGSQNNPVTNTDLRIDGKEITATSGSVTAGEGTIEYKVSANSETGKNDVEITLNKAELTSAAEAAISYLGKGEVTVTLKVKGENKITGADHAIYAPYAKLTIKGTKEDSLKAVTVNKTPAPSAIIANTITIDDPLEISEPENNKIGTRDEYVKSTSETVTCNTITDLNASGHAAISVMIETPQYTITYDPGEGGEGTMDADHVYKGDKLTLPESTFTAPDNKVFDQWSIDGSTYDAKKEVDITQDTTVIALWKDAPECDHEMHKTAAKAATCEEDGNKEYYTCSVCNKLFKDVDGKNPIELKDTIVKATGHKWGEPTYKWADDNSSVTATRVCEHDSKHVETETATAKLSVSKAATCEKDGTVTYTASFEKNKAFETQTKENVKIAALGHTWGAPEFSWDKDYSKATVTRTCTHDSSHTESEDAKVTGMITVPTDKVAGKIEYTATVTFDGKTFTDVKSKPIAKAGTKGYNFTVKPNAWVKNSRNSLGFTVKRSSYDAMTFAAFDKITIDGKTVENKNNTAYTTEKGSLKLTFKPAYLNSLSAGSHTLKIFFKDGSVETTFNVQTTSATGNGTAARTTNATTNRTANATTNRTATGSPTTGDTSNWPLWIGLLAASAAAICGIVFVRRRSKQNEAGAGEEED